MERYRAVPDAGWAQYVTAGQVEWLDIAAAFVTLMKSGGPVAGPAVEIAVHVRRSPTEEMRRGEWKALSNYRQGTVQKDKT